VLTGQLWVNVPLLAILLGVAALISWVVGPSGHGATVLPRAIHELRVPIGGIIGIALAWLWWSYNVPRWRAWALAQGADAAELQEQAVRSGLVWPRGSILEKTEFRLRSRR
jgi:hypothetical protein